MGAITFSWENQERLYENRNRVICAEVSFCNLNFRNLDKTYIYINL